MLKSNLYNDQELFDTLLTTNAIDIHMLNNTEKKYFTSYIQMIFYLHKA